jgi:uncharacterized Zn finger protein
MAKQTKPAAALRPLSESDLKRWISAESLVRGRRYFANGAIVSPRRVGATLKAECTGSRPTPYRVEATLGPKGIVADDCSCPIGGRCKHVAALLYTWIDDPDAFTTMDDVDTLLAKRSQAELTDLIHKMIDRYPDLELLLELPPPTNHARGKPIEPSVIQRQVRHAFAGAGDEWGYAGAAAHELEGVVDTGDQYAQHGDWLNAATVYETIMRGVLDEYESVQDEEGDLNEIVNRCVAGLGKCLNATDAPLRRQHIVRALFDVYLWDVEYGGIDMGYPAHDLMLKQTTPSERQQLIGWAQKALPTGNEWSAGWHRQVLGRLLLDLQKDMLDDEAYLAVCRKTGRIEDLVDRLLKLDRFDEAIEEARRADDYILLQLADIFVKHRRTQDADQLIRARAPKSKDTRLVEWLKKQAVKRGDKTEVLELTEQLFKATPSLEDYRQVRAAAVACRRWEQVRPTLLAHLTKAKDYALLTEIYLLDKDIDAALESVEKVKYAWYDWGHETLSIRVAKAAEKDRPEAALRIYQTTVDRLINSRGRDNYKTATRYLKRMRPLFQHLNQQDAWEALIARIREKNRALRALKEELDRAGL